MAVHPVQRQVRKVIQAVGVILRRYESRTASRLRLNKLLCIANREAYRRLGRPLIDLPLVAMQQGPVFSDVLDMINERHRDTDEWCKYFERVEPHNVRMKGESEHTCLSQFEIELLQETVDRYVHLDDYELVELTHTFPEWKENYPDEDEKTSRPITKEQIVRSVGGEFADDILADLNHLDRFDAEFSR